MSKSAVALSGHFESYWKSRLEALEEVQGWPVFATTPLPRTERCDTKKDSRGWRVVPELEETAAQMIRRGLFHAEIPNPLAYVGFDELDWMCRDMAGGDFALYDRLYRETDLVEIMKHIAAAKATIIRDRVVAHLELLRSLD